MEPRRQTPKQQHTLPTPPTTEVHESLTSLLLRIGSGNSHHPSPIQIAPPILKQQQPVPLSPYKQNITSSSQTLSNYSPVLFAKLVETLIDAGADLDTDMGLYLKSLLFTGGGMGYGNTSGGGEAHIAWLVNESHRETKMKEENAILTGLLIDEITGASNGGKIQAGFAASYFCIVGCHSEALKVLLETGKVGVNGMDNFLVQVACQVGSLDCVKVLCEYAYTTGVQGFDLWARDGGALRLAKLGEHEELVKYLEQEMLHKREE
ncbi:hypothetical protein BDR26DRAFT_661651 [Obelidium mucronatum]|nr:hypothetical protein BDR26DRAFT_661651 [Obelidium mucronatum]